jgi:DNA-binding transcriptional regulator YhcF (GntR family)
MNLNRLYALLASRTNADGTIRLPSWHDIAAAAEVAPEDDTRAFRALRERGLIESRTIPNSYGDQQYKLRRPAPEYVDAVAAMLRIPDGASVRHLLAH